eukprot:superscaffoldBa00000357_g4068
MFQGESLDIPKHLWKRSRGYRVGVKPHEKKRKYMLFIPSIIMGNVRAWESEFVALTRSQREYLECSIMCVMEIWLHDHIPNSNMTINSFQGQAGLPSQQTCQRPGEEAQVNDLRQTSSPR